jgi:hypothetical protein
LELLFTLAILGICVAGLLTAFSTTMAASAEQRGLVTLNTFVRAGSAELFTAFQSGAGVYVSCATPASYQALTASLPALPTGYSESITSVEYLSNNGYSTTCPSGSTAPQLITFSVTGRYNTGGNNSFVVQDIQSTTTNPPTKLIITSPSLSGPASASATLGQITVEEVDALGNPTTSAETVNLASNSTGTNEFATTLSGTPVTSVSIPSGSSSATFYYGDTLVGTPTLTVTATGLTGATQQETIVAGPVKKLLITSSPVSGAAAASATLGQITVEEVDAFNNLTTTAETVNLSSSSKGTTEFATAAKGTSVTSVSIPSGSSSVSFYYGDTLAGTPTITASATGLTSATQQETIVAGPASKLVFITSPVSGSASASATEGPITVGEVDAFGNASTTAETVGLASSSSGTHEFAGTLGGTAETSVTISSGSSNATFYYGDSLAGTPTLTATAAGLTSASQQVTVNGPSLPTITTPSSGSPESLTKNTSSATFTITGTGFTSNATVSFSGGFSLTQVNSVTSTTISVTVSVGSSKGTFNLTVTDPFVGSVTSDNSIVVKP